MPRGDAEITDQILYKRIQKFDRPITIKDLVTRLNWSRGKIDGAIGRLTEKKSIAIVNTSLPKGQRQRYVGIPGKEYWKSFHQHYFVKNKYILLYDTLGVIQEFQRSSEGPGKGINLSNVQDRLPETNIDSSILEVLEDNLEQLKSLALSRNMTIPQLLENRFPYLLLPDFVILMKIASVIAEEAQSDNETERAVALKFIKRASAQLNDQL
jgi:DNA-binding transcriptional regulator GbsR (MarR family)